MLPNYIYFTSAINFCCALMCSNLFLKTYLYLLRGGGPCIYPIRVPPLQKPLLCPDPILTAVYLTLTKPKNFLFCF